METFNPTPQLTVLSGPMGGGKSGGNAAILEGLKRLDIQTWGVPRVMSISETSRGRREELGEPEDAYVFNTPVERFETAVQTGALMERTEHSGTHYGSPTPQDGQPTHLEIEVSGLRQIMDSVHPRVVAARAGIRAAYLLQDSMGALFNQIMGRNDGMSKEKKIQRIARYPSEILYILERELPYVFISNPNGIPDYMAQHLIKYMSGSLEVMTEDGHTAKLKAEEAVRWLARMGVDPEPVVDPVD